MGRNSATLRAFPLAASLVAAGCSGGQLSNPLAPDADTGSGLAALAGTWDGYAEAVTFMPDGSDRVRLTINANGSGTVAIGNAAPLAPATVPNVGYPPSTPDVSGFYEGFGYPVHAAVVSSNRIQLGLNPSDIYASWCPLQTSYPLYQLVYGDGSTRTAYGCVDHGITFGVGSGEPSDAGTDAGLQCTITNGDGGPQPIDCGKLQLCLEPACLCSANGCVPQSLPASTPVDSYPGLLDATFDTATLNGTLLFVPEGRLTIHLTKTSAH